MAPPLVEPKIPVPLYLITSSLSRGFTQVKPLSSTETLPLVLTIFIESVPELNAFVTDVLDNSPLLLMIAALP